MDRDFDELTELTELYGVQKARIDAMVKREVELGTLHPGTAREVEVAARILASRAQVKKDLGLVGEFGVQRAQIRDLKGYSRKTAEVLSRPDSRRRVISIVERVKRMCEAETGAALPAEAAE